MELWSKIKWAIGHMPKLSVLTFWIQVEPILSCAFSKRLMPLKDQKYHEEGGSLTSTLNLAFS
jgi:hypothetical protein